MGCRNDMVWGFPEPKFGVDLSWLALLMQGKGSRGEYADMLHSNSDAAYCIGLAVTGDVLPAADTAHYGNRQTLRKFQAKGTRWIIVWHDTVMLIRTHHGCRWRFDLVTAFLSTVDGTVTDVFCGYQVKFLNIVQNFAIFQAFIFRVVPSFAGLTWRRYHLVLLSCPERYHPRRILEPGTR